MIQHRDFNHDFSKFKANCETDRQVIEALGSVFEGSNRPLVITSGTGLVGQGRRVLATEIRRLRPRSPVSLLSRRQQRSRRAA